MCNSIHSKFKLLNHITPQKCEVHTITQNWIEETSLHMFLTSTTYNSLYCGPQKKGGVYGVPRVTWTTGRIVYNIQNICYNLIVKIVLYFSKNIITLKIDATKLKEKNNFSSETQLYIIYALVNNKFIIFIRTQFIQLH